MRLGWLAGSFEQEERKGRGISHKKHFLLFPAFLFINPATHFIKTEVMWY